MDFNISLSSIVVPRRAPTFAEAYFEDEHGRRMAMKRLTRNEARRIAANFAKLPGQQISGAKRPSAK